MTLDPAVATSSSTTEASGSPSILQASICGGRGGGGGGGGRAKNFCAEGKDFPHLTSIKIKNIDASWKKSYIIL